MKVEIEIPPFLSVNLGEVDHRKVDPPYLRLVSARAGNAGDIVGLYDLRLSRPNQSFVPAAVMHSIEHLLNVFLAKRLGGFINCAPMGCQTGFYITVMGPIDWNELERSLAGAFGDALRAEVVPLCNVYQCGRAANHDLTGAKSLAKRVLLRREKWRDVY